MSDQNEKKVGLKEQIGYGIGGLGMQLANKTVSQYLLVFFTNCLFLDPIMAGTIFMWGRIVDAITDIIMANISDKTRTRFGTYRPYIIYGTVPLAISFIFAFFCPSFIQASGKTLVWAYVFYFLEASVFNTITGMNYGAMANAVTREPIGRSKLASARNVGESAATLLIGALCMSTVNKYGGTSEPKGWLIMGIIFAVLICAGYYICVFLVKENFEVAPKQETLGFRERLRTLKGNKPFYGIVLSIAFLMFIAVFGGTFFAYYCMYNLRQPAWIAPLVTIGGAAGIVASAFLVVPLTKKFEKRQVLMLGSALWIVGSLLLIIIGGYVGGVVYQIVTGAGNAICLAAIWASVPDMCDYGAWKNKVASPGIVYSICMFVLKVVTGFASYGVGAILSLTGFDAKLGLDQAVSVMNGIRVSIGIVPAAFGLLIILCTFLMKDIDKEKMVLYKEAR